MLLFTEQLGQVRVLTDTASLGRVTAEPGLFGHICIGKVLPLQLYCCITAKSCSWRRSGSKGPKFFVNRGYSSSNFPSALYWLFQQKHFVLFTQVVTGTATLAANLTSVQQYFVPETLPADTLSMATDSCPKGM